MKSYFRFSFLQTSPDNPMCRNSSKSLIYEPSDPSEPSEIFFSEGCRWFAQWTITKSWQSVYRPLLLRTVGEVERRKMLMLRSVFSFVQRQIPQAAARARPASAAQCSCFSSSSIGGRQPLHTGPKDQLFLHVSPSGDCWTGQEIFAAKHLQPDYVRSIPVPDGFDPDEHLISGDARVAQKRLSSWWRSMTTARFPLMSWSDFGEMWPRLNKGIHPIDLKVDEES